MIARYLTIAFMVTAGSAQAAQNPQGMVEFCAAFAGTATLAPLIDATGVWRNSDGLLTHFWFYDRMGILFMDGMMPFPTFFSPISVDEENSISTLQALFLGDLSKSPVWALRQNWNEDRSGFSLTLDAPDTAGPIHYSFVRDHIAKQKAPWGDIVNTMKVQCETFRSGAPSVK